MISVIIPTFNRGSLIKETIESILNQTYKDFEIIIIDDHSTDNTFQIVNRFANLDNRVYIYKRPLNLPKGGNSCRNFGLKVSRGDYIKWLDSDDLLEPSALELQYQNILNMKSDVSVCNSINFTTDPIFRKTSRWGSLNGSISPSSFISGLFRWHTCSGLWNRQYFENLEVWEIGLTNSQEWLMHLTQIVNGCRISIVEDELCLIRVHKGSMSSSNNKSGRYYFNEVKARLFAIDILYKNRETIDKEAKRKIFHQIYIYHIFSAYKLNFFGFFQLFFYYFFSIHKITFIYFSK